jgi:hypothetical protein
VRKRGQKQVLVCRYKSYQFVSNLITKCTANWQNKSDTRSLLLGNKTITGQALKAHADVALLLQ